MSWSCLCLFLDDFPFLLLFLIILSFLLPCLYIRMVYHIYILWIILSIIWGQWCYLIPNQICICSVRRLALTIIVPFALIKDWDILSQKLIFMLLQKLAYLLITLIYRVANLVQCKAWSNYWCHLLHWRPFNSALPCPPSSLFINMFKTLLRLLAISDQVYPVLQERN